MSGWTECDSRFASSGESLGASVFKIEYPGPGEGPTWMVLFPDGYVDPVDLRDPAQLREAVPRETVRTLAERHHPIRVVEGEADIDAYWAKRRYHFQGGAR